MDLNEEVLEKLEYTKIEIIKFLQDCFDEQKNENVDFFNNILDLVKSEIRTEEKSRTEDLQKTLSELEHSIDLNRKITDELLYRLELIEPMREDTSYNNILYKDIKQGIKQYVIQVGITLSIILMLLGGYQLIKFFT